MAGLSANNKRRNALKGALLIEGEYMEKIDNNCGKVWLVGAGPGDLGLFTQKGMEVLNDADVVVYDALISLELLALMPTNAELIDVGKRANHHLVPQEQINEILLKKAKEGKRVVRLKGGDPFVFGRGGEELELLSRENIPFEVVPGVTSSVAVAAYNGIPVTHRDYTSSFHIVTGHKKKNGSLDINFKALVEMNSTLVFLMGVSALDTICKRLMEEGMSPDTPAAILEKGTTCRQKRVVATVSTLKAEADKKAIKSPAVIVVGKVCLLEKEFGWFEKKPLFGKQILITRPKSRASSLAKKLRNLGAQVVEFPAIDTVPVTELKKEDLLFKALKKLESDSRNVCIAFTSPQGVKHFFGQLKEYKYDLRKLLCKENIQFAVIGSGTKKELELYNIFADYMPEEYSAGALGELLSNSLNNETAVYIFRAEEGSPQLTEKLYNKGIPYEDIPVYKTVYVKGTPIVEKIENAICNNDIDYVTFTSGSTVKGFVNIFTDIDYKKINAVCIGQQTAKEAEKYGMKIFVSKQASIDSMVELMLEL